jgi:hypothetical protein
MFALPSGVRFVLYILRPANLLGQPSPEKVVTSIINKLH